MVEVANFRYWDPASQAWIAPRFKSALSRIRGFRNAELLRSTLEYVPAEALDLHGRYRPDLARREAPAPAVYAKAA